MAHVKPGVETLAPRTIAQIRNLFATARHAHTQLGIEGIVPYAELYRGLNGASIKNEIGHVIETALDRWRTLYLNPAWVFNHSFTLPPFDGTDESWRDLEPMIKEWKAAYNN